MSSPITTNAVKERLLQDSEASDGKQQLGTVDYEVPQNRETPPIEPRQPQRYWARTLVLILIPSAVTIWYGIIWVWLVLGIENDDAAKYRTFSGSLVFYSWFIIGVFALSWAKYGLLGVEVAMLESRFWRAPNLVAFLMHSNSTWSSPSGWLKGVYHRVFPRLWCLLVFLSILPFIAFPLSGLVFEIGDGYVAIPDHPMVVGSTEHNFNNLSSDARAAKPAWEAGVNPAMPGFGVVYTPPGFDRTGHSGLEKVPNTLPLTESIPSMFLAPQAQVPVSGRTWGLQVNYSCSNVLSASEFTILSEKPESTLESVIKYQPTDGSQRPYAKLKTPSGAKIHVFNSSADSSLNNVWSYSEMGSNFKESVPGIYESSRDNSETIVFEYALWQLQFLGYYEDQASVRIPFNTTVDPIIEGMGSPYIMLENKTVVSNDTFFTIKGGDGFTVQETLGGPIIKVNSSLTDLRAFFIPEQLLRNQDRLPVLNVAPPIGVRCVWSSAAGTATLDGVTSTFSGFERVDPESAGGYGRVFGTRARQILLTVPFSNLYQASHLPMPVTFGSLSSLTTYVHSQALLQSVLLACGLDALELMYNVISAFEKAWLHPDLTSSREGKILTIASLIPGIETGYLVLALFCLWAVLSLALGIVYGFRKRTSDKLDGYSVFRRGADLSEDLKHNEEFQSGQSFYNNETFQKLPGT
ncbi:hypothetical protein jhhlp_004253 [Lomentospora prolificans]|uniref:Uncharacterized protein n=1 Tax=Lomentospora prolificans TaxID=41688 RepID=A0A2N3NB31_9PEZI|nr:hypothetical protein jhhlp_004253 [Lomentospora prolificans]